MGVCACVLVADAQVCACVTMCLCGGQGKMSCAFSITLGLISLGQGLSPNQKFAFFANLPGGSWDPSALAPQCFFFFCHLYGNWGYLNSGPPACKASALTY